MLDGASLSSKRVQLNSGGELCANSEVPDTLVQEELLLQQHSALVAHLLQLLLQAQVVLDLLFRVGVAQAVTVGTQKVLELHLQPLHSVRQHLILLCQASDLKAHSLCLASHFLALDSLLLGSLGFHHSLLQLLGQGVHLCIQFGMSYDGRHGCQPRAGLLQLRLHVPYHFLGILQLLVRLAHLMLQGFRTLAVYLCLVQLRLELVDLSHQVVALLHS
mmetsp:Transcript_17948/g.38532  ORF Transcript_17948/g.38532 Transcript_17948/m.38532 type:complete len:218 (-) Transcript_17948:677-1330(-)